EADDLAQALREYLPGPQVATFPSWETLPHERLSPRSDTVGQRLAVLRRLAHPEEVTEEAPVDGVSQESATDGGAATSGTDSGGDQGPAVSVPAYGPIQVLVASARALLQPFVAGLGDLVPVRLSAGETHDFEEVVEALSAAAYTRTDLVERRGEF